MPTRTRSRKKKSDEHDELDDAPDSTATQCRFDMPQNPDELARFVRDEMDVHVAPSALIQGSDGPLAYLVHSFFEGRFTVLPDGAWIDHDKDNSPRPPGDCVVWANRGGGKTFLGAVATALDMIFKPTIEIRILGGSAEQSRRMHEHLRAIFEREQFQHLLDGRTTESRVRLTIGSRAEILSHSERSVRGVRVQKLRCDEVDLFDPELWQAAQLVTRSARPIPGPWGNEVRGVIEVLSTMHVPMGMMWNIVREAGRSAEWAPPPSPGSAGEGRGEGAVESAPAATRLGSASPVQGGAPHADLPHATDPAALGGVCADLATTIDPTDIPGATDSSALGGVGAPSGPQTQTLPQARESLRHSTHSRLLFKWGVVDSLEHCTPAYSCDSCSLFEDCAGKAKHRGKGGHMTIADARVLKQRSSRATWNSEMLCNEPSRTGCVYPEFSPAVHVLPREVSEASALRSGHKVVAGMDFGVRAPTVILWAQLTDDGVLTVVDEYAEEGRTLAHHISSIRLRQWGGGDPAWIGIDPAGTARNDQTGHSNYAVMRNSGLHVRARRCALAAGLESVRQRLSPAQGAPTLLISPRCTRLIEALARYHYPVNKPQDPAPEKDGHDHWCDALRYMVTNLEQRGVAVGWSG